MTRAVLSALVATSALMACTGIPALPDAGGSSAFRVRSDFAAPLNQDTGWAGAMGENVVIQADRPFRIRFEVEGSGEGGAGPLGLQVRRNEGAWVALEAHDFPYSQRSEELAFGDVDVGATPPGWTVALGSAAGMTVVEEGGERVLRAQAGDEALVALHPSPWELDDFTLVGFLRFPAGGGNAALVFSYEDDANHGLVFLDQGAGQVRLSRIVGGAETVLAERQVAVPTGAWIELEVQGEGDLLEVKVQDDVLEFSAPWDPAHPAEGLGFLVPAGGTVEFREFLLEGVPSTPGVSIVTADAYDDDAPTTDLLSASALPFQPGVGVSGAERADWASTAGTHTELEWPLVIRHLADGAVAHQEGDTFAFRMVDGDDAPMEGTPQPRVTLTIPPGHLGGTFVETPGRIGPWQASNGDLYFIMEPTETDNLFLMMKSTDQGRSWREVDAANRPGTGDLESVDGRLVDGTIHIIHQITEASLYHAFHTSDHPTAPDQWGVTDQVAATATAVAQLATLVVRSDGSMVTFYTGETVRYAQRSPDGTWGSESILDPDLGVETAGPQAVLGADDTVHLGYYGMDGTIWYRRLLPDGTLTPREPLASGAGATRAEFGAVLPLVFIPGSNTVVVVYRLDDGTLWERRVTGDGAPTPPVQVTDRRVITDAVDAQQPAADVVVDGETVHLLFVEESSRSLFHTHDAGGWQPPTLQVDGILGSWVRGTVYTRPDGLRVYGYVYDAGSFGGAGMNRFGEVVLEGR